MKSKSFFFRISRNNKFLEKIYLWYNVYIRNFEYHFINSHKNSQFGEEKFIFKHFSKNFKGKFLDIGCFHPTRNNNTYKLYKRGWTGINIDLNPISIDLFNLARPKDVNICTAISDKKSVKKLYFLGDLNTTNTIEKNHTKFLNQEFSISNSDIETRKVKTETLNHILEKYKYYKIDFMNIDIEGHELKALTAFNFKKFDIKLICIEIINHNKKSVSVNNKLIKFLKIKGYTLQDKIAVNYIFKKK
ncbi:FkbM family methyltransferase [Candidatus Pelagibacter sp.]|nr:FkbM family methyltransferase [Candidatus Pelagibacter sp.]